EAEQKALGAQLADPDFYKTAPQRAGELQARYAAIEEEMLELLARWEALEAA
ncbi:MAG: hypothetical protein B7X42_01820, partial [Thiomonas sp. 14-66-4]